MSSESSKNSFNSIGSLEIPVQEVSLNDYVSLTKTNNDRSKIKNNTIEMIPPDLRSTHEGKPLS